MMTHVLRIQELEDCDTLQILYISRTLIIFSLSAGNTTVKCFFSKLKKSFETIWKILILQVHEN